MCRPARIIRGRSARSSIQRVSAGLPASRSSSAPAARSASACSSARASETAPCASSPTWQCASTRPGISHRSVPTVSASAHRLGADQPVDHPQVPVLAVGQHHAAEVQPDRPELVEGRSEPRQRLLAEAAAQLRRQLELGHRLLHAPPRRSRRRRRRRPGRRPARSGPAHCAWPGCPRRRGRPSSSAAWRPASGVAGIPGIAGMPPGILPPASELIILRASKNRLTRPLTSLTSTPAPRAIRARREPSMILGLSRSAGVIEWMIASIRSTSFSSMLLIWSLISPIPGSMPKILDSGPILRTICICCRKSASPKSLPSLDGQLGRGLGRLVGVEGLLGLLDQGEHVAHAEDPAGHPVGMEDVEVLQRLAVGGEHDRPAGHPGDGQGRAAAGVAVQLGQHDPVEADALGERVRRVDRVLADHRVDDEQHLVGVHRVADVRGLLHQLGVDAQPAGGVDDDHVVQPALRLADRVLGHGDRVADAVARLRGVDVDAGPLADDLELVDRVRALQVGRDQQRRVPLILQPEPRACRPAWSCRSPAGRRA